MPAPPLLFHLHRSPAQNWNCKYCPKELFIDGIFCPGCFSPKQNSKKIFPWNDSGQLTGKWKTINITRRLIVLSKTTLQPQLKPQRCHLWAIHIRRNVYTKLADGVMGIFNCLYCLCVTRVKALEPMNSLRFILTIICFALRRTAVKSFQIYIHWHHVAERFTLRQVTICTLYKFQLCNWRTRQQWKPPLL